MGDGRKAGQASNQATEVGRVGTGHCRDGQIPGEAPANGSRRFKSHDASADQCQLCQLTPGQPPTTITGGSVSTAGSQVVRAKSSYRYAPLNTRNRDTPIGSHLNSVQQLISFVVVTRTNRFLNLRGVHRVM